MALLRSPEFMRRVQKVGEYIRFVSPLDKRLNEFAAIIGGGGCYTLLAMVMNVARTGVPEGKPLPLPALPLRALP